MNEKLNKELIDFIQDCDAGRNENIYEIIDVNDVANTKISGDTLLVWATYRLPIGYKIPSISFLLRCGADPWIKSRDTYYEDDDGFALIDIKGDAPVRNPTVAMIHNSTSKILHLVKYHRYKSKEPRLNEDTIKLVSKSFYKYF